MLVKDQERPCILFMNGLYLIDSKVVYCLLWLDMRSFSIYWPSITVSTYTVSSFPEFPVYQFTMSVWLRNVLKISTDAQIHQGQRSLLYGSPLSSWSSSFCLMNADWNINSSRTFWEYLAYILRMKVVKPF